MKSLLLPNRIVMAPMSRYKSVDGIPNRDTALYYQRRAQANVGLIITESTFIDPSAHYNVPDAPIFYGEAALQGWRQVVESVHNVGGKIFAQIMHAGGARQPNDYPYGATALAPSTIPHPFIANAQPPQAMSLQQIEKTIDSFVTAAVAAKEIGFDGVEIHGAHGYLIDQFFWEYANKRTDKYGGASLGARTRFASEVIQAVRRAAGDNFPISFRYSQWKLGDYNARMINSPQQLAEFLQPLSEAGVDIFHVSTRYFDAPAFAESNLSLATWTKRISGKPTIAVGSVGYRNDFVSSVIHQQTTEISQTNLYAVEDAIANNEYDLIAIGRPLIADPQWWAKAARNDFQTMQPFTQAALESLV